MTQEKIQIAKQKIIVKMTADEENVMEVETDISAAQKMLSAVSGSLLTSLLGRLCPPTFAAP